MIIFGPGQRLHARTAGPCHWGAIQAPAQDLLQYGQVLSDAEFVVSPRRDGDHRPRLRGDVRHLHRAAIRMAEGDRACHRCLQPRMGLEQHLIDALIECVSSRAGRRGNADRPSVSSCSCPVPGYGRGQPFPRMTEIRRAFLFPADARERRKKHFGTARR